MIHKSGKEIPVCDFWSRSFLPETYANYSAGLDVHVHTIFAAAFCHRQRLEAIQQTIVHDRQMQTLQKTIVQGWPET